MTRATTERWQRVKEIVDDALDLEPGPREAFLTEVCSGDRSLRSEVDELITSYEEAASFIESPPYERNAGSIEDDQPRFEAGHRIGRFQIVSRLGAGGMSEVYLANDSKLDRKVAIKLLPADLVSEPAARHRLVREAKAAAKLDHPHICAINEIDEDHGITFMVMQYVEGETLARRIRRGPLSPQDTVDIAAQIASALTEAHSHGIIHRDIKPENVMIATGGQVKVMDFGLAKIVIDRTKPRAATEAESSLTEPGFILGTVAYMSPEQARGLPVDGRTDIWSLGVVLYEMATGKRAFTGKSPTSVIAAVLEREPEPIKILQPMTPPALERVVNKCLAKNPDERWQTARDLMDELRWIAGAGMQADSPPVQVIKRKSRGRLAWTAITGILCLALALLLAYAIGYLRASRPGPALARASILPPEGATFLPSNGMAVSPDGLRLAFVARGPDGKATLWVRPLDSLSAQPLAGTDGATLPFWSAEGRFIGFFAGGKLRKIDAFGGPAQTLCEAPNPRGGTWSRDGVILFAPEITGPLERVPAAGGLPVPATRLEEARAERTHRWPYFLPDGRHFLYMAAVVGFGGQPNDNRVYLGSLDSNEQKQVLQAGTNVAYASGHLLFWRDGMLMAQAFDEKSLQTAGSAFPVAEQVEFTVNTSRAGFSCSANGILAFQSGTTSGNSQLIWFDRTGKQTSSLTDPGYYSQPHLSPDGQRVALRVADPRSGMAEIWLRELSSGVATRLTFGRGVVGHPVWSPDGSKIVFRSYRNGHFDLYQKASNGAGSEDPLIESDEDKLPEDWSPDGRFILYTAEAETVNNPNRKGDLWILPMFGTGKPSPFLQTQFEKGEAQFSPDGRWIAYVSNESGSEQVYIVSFPGAGGKRQVSVSGGGTPRWRRDGKELFFLDADSRLLAVDIRERGGTLEIGNAQPLFDAHPGTAPGFHYDVSRDGQHFLIDTNVEQSSVPLTLVLNWTADLKR